MVGIRGRALEHADQGRWEDAAVLLGQCVEVIRGFGIDDPRIQSEIEELEEMARNLRFRGEEYYSPVVRKRAFYASELASKGRFDQVASMRIRRSEDYLDPDRIRRNRRR